MKTKEKFDKLTWSREYYSREDVKQRRKERNKRPDVLEKHRKATKIWYEKNKNKVENNRLLREFNITLDDYNNLFNLQKGCCAICSIHQIELKTKLHVDHCHTTGKVRGLLCYNCNRAIGLLKDNVESLKRASQYLAEYDWS